MHFKDFGLSSPLLTCLSFSFRFQNMQKDVGFIHISDALTEAMLDHPRERQNPKTSATLHESASAQKETNATLHENAFRFLMGPQSGPPKSPKPFILNGLKRFFANTKKHHLKTWNGRPRNIEKQSARAPKMQHYTNRGAPSIGKGSTGDTAASRWRTSPRCMRIRFL